MDQVQYPEGLCQLSRLLIDNVSAILPRAQAVSRHMRRAAIALGIPYSSANWAKSGIQCGIGATHPKCGGFA
jgi:hypothetical protein